MSSQTARLLLWIDGTISPDSPTSGIVIRTISNTLTKAAIVWIFGTRQLGHMVTAILGAVAVVGLLFVLIL